MSSLINKQKIIKDSLEFFKNKDLQAKFSVDTLSDKDLLRVGSTFLDSVHKTRMALIPTIYKWESELKTVTYSIDSLSKMK
jgi:hypothetical protein